MLEAEALFVPPDAVAAGIASAAASATAAMMRVFIDDPPNGWWTAHACSSLVATRRRRGPAELLVYTTLPRFRTFSYHLGECQDQFATTSYGRPVAVPVRPGPRVGCSNRSRSGSGRRGRPSARTRPCCRVRRA